MIVLYARKSVENLQSVSCETQIQYCKAMIRPEERDEEVVTLVDNGFSGGNTDRAGYQQLLQFVRLGKVSRVIVYRLDRISRSLADFVSFLSELKAHNVSFTSSQEAFDTSSPYGSLVCQILAVLAEFERNSIIERVKQAYQHRSELAFYMGGRRPYGFTLVDTVIRGIKTKMLQPDEREMAYVRQMFDLYSVAGVSLRRAMDNLIKENAPATEGGWSTAKISAILRNPIYVQADAKIYEYFASMNTKIVGSPADFDGTHGLQLYGKTMHEAEDWSDIKAVLMQHEGVIPSEVWLACQRKLAKNKQINKSMSNQTSWLGGRVICAQCGKKMTVTRGGKRVDGTSLRYFNCVGRANRACKGSKATIYADSLEQMVSALVAEKLAALKNYRRQVSNENGAKINQLRCKLVENRTAQDKLAMLVMTDGLEADMLSVLNEKAKQLAAERRKLTEKIEALEATEQEIVNVLDFGKAWEKATYDEKKAVVGVLIDKLLVAEDGSIEVVWNI